MEYISVKKAIIQKQLQMFLLFWINAHYSKNAVMAYYFQNYAGIIGSALPVLHYVLYMYSV